MSLKSTSGTSLTEVMIMMVILGISMVGIYSMVNSGQKLSSLAYARLTALNIAREWIESVSTLRDTFDLSGYSSGTCTGTNPDVDAFFSIDGGLLLDSNCPEINLPYTLQDDKTLINAWWVFDICNNESGWYSQEFSSLWGNTLAICRTGPNPIWCVPCSTTPTICTGNTIQSCKTRFKRNISFDTCIDPVNSQYCLIITSKVWWGDNENDSDTSLTLSQIITPLD